MIDIDKALFDPDSVFQKPEEVVECEELSREQKIKILEQWEYDAREMAVAEEENMAASNGDGGDLLHRIHELLVHLEAR